MPLVDPTDYEILAFLTARGRNNAMNIAAGLDRDRSYVNTRLRALARGEHIERIGPAPNSGLYEVTDDGRAELAAWTEYGGDDVDDVSFETLVGDD